MLLTMNNQSQPRLIGRRKLKRANGGRVVRKQESMHSKRGWAKTASDSRGDHYQGCFLANGKQFPGKATVTRSRLDLYIRNIPQRMGGHIHAACFSPRSGGWYQIHYVGRGNLDSGILEIENILTDAMKRNDFTPELAEEEAKTPWWMRWLAKLFP